MNVATTNERQLTAERRKWIAALILGAFALHGVFFFNYPPGDVAYYIIPWYKQIMVSGLSEPVGNYSPPYLYLLAGLTVLDGLLPTIALVKLLSLVGAAWLAFACCRLLKLLGATPELGFTVLLLPSVISNTSLLGQADTFWVAPCVLAVASAVRERLVWVAVWSGVAFAFKLQSIFLAPFVIHLFFVRRAALQIWAIVPATYVFAMIPAWLSGWPAWDLANIYLDQIRWRQVPEKGLFVSNGASWWTVYGWLNPSLALQTFWIGFALAAAALARLMFVPALFGRKLVVLAVLSAAVAPFLLPGMHERFHLLADVLAFIYALAYPSRRSIAAAILMQIASALPVYVWAFEAEPTQLIAPPIAAVAIFLLVRELVGPAELRRFSCH